MNQSGKIQQYIEKHKRKTLNGAKLVKGFCGAPNRIRTCGLLIRSQTLYPAELWVQSSFFLFRSLGTRMIIPRIAENVNTFLKNIFHFLALRPKRGISAKTRATFGGWATAGKERKEDEFFSCSNKKKASKNGKK